MKILSTNFKIKIFIIAISVLIVFANFSLFLPIIDNSKILEEEEIIQLTNLDIPTWRIFNGINIPELHDRMIVSTFYQHKASAILTNDKEIAEITPIIWG